jgi:hypothetical protein
MQNSDLKNDLLSIRDDIICGFHSGFPACCIKFYVTKWIWNIGSKTNQKHWKKIRSIKSFIIEYIPCPKCLENRTFVKYKKCPKSCIKLKRVRAWIKKSKLKTKGKAK